MTSPIDPQVLWQQWLNQQADWSEVIQQQTSPLFKTTLEQIQAASSLYQEIAQKILPHTLATEPTPEAMHKWLEAIQETMSQWAQRQYSASTVEATGSIFQTQVQHWERAQQAIQHYQQIAKRYQQALEQVTEQVFSTFKAKVLDKPSEVTSLQHLIDQWGKSYEYAYSVWTHSHDYQSLYAELVNAGTNLKSALHNQLQPLLAWLNVPTQQEWQLVAERYHELRRAHQALSGQVEALTEQVALLKKAQAS